MLRKVVRLFSLSLLVLVLGPLGVARAETIVVDNGSDDLTDPTPTDATCDTTGDHGCTLRAAIQTANRGSSGPDTITFDPSVTTVTLSIVNATANGENNSLTGDLDILHDAATPAGQSDVTINGPGPGALTIDGAGVDRVFQLPRPVLDAGFGIPRPTPPAATITGVKITGGSAMKDPGGAEGNGGGIDSWGTLTLDNVDVNGNTIDSSNSGGICGGVIEDDGAVTVRNSTFEHNTSRFGGALCEDGGGTVDVSDSTFTENESTTTGGDGDGGAIMEDGGGTLNVTRVVADNNTANQGGGLEEDGGGVVTVTDSTFKNNHAVLGEGEHFTDGDGAAIGEDGGGTVTIERTTINHNDAEFQGGAIFADGGSGEDGDFPFNIVNSTITGNTAGNGGGGIFIDGSDVIGITNATINGNAVTPVPDSRFVTIPGDGGNIEICSNEPRGSCSPTDDSRINAATGEFGTINATNTIVSAGAPSSCFIPDGAINSLGHNIDSENTCGFDKPNTDPRLDALGDNGGPTQTEALLTGSPAIDAASSDCPPPSTDQRGIGRPQGGACDIGAFEVFVPGSIPPPPLRPATVTPAPSCTDLRKFRFHVHHRHGIRIVAVKVFIDGKLRKHVKGHDIKFVTIDKLPQRTFRVRIEQFQHRGGELVSKRTYNGCVKGKPKTKRRHSNKRKHHHH